MSVAADWPYDPERGKRLIDEYEAEATKEQAIADALGQYAELHDRSATTFRTQARAIRDRLVADGFLIAEVKS